MFYMGVFSGLLGNHMAQKRTILVVTAGSTCHNFLEVLWLKPPNETSANMSGLSVCNGETCA